MVLVPLGPSTIGLFYKKTKYCFNDLKNNLDYEEHGGTSFLGINGIVFKSHGSSSSKGIKNTFHSAYNAHKNNILINISKRIESYSLDV